MVAKTLVASGAVNVDANWLPLGVPATTDTFSFGAFTGTVPTGYTWNVPPGGMQGIDESNRGTLVCEDGSQLKLFGDITPLQFNEFIFDGDVVIDTNGFNFKFDYFGTPVHNKMSHTNGSHLKLVDFINTSGTRSTVGATDGTTMYGYCRMPYTRTASNVDWCFGSGYFAGNHFDMTHSVFHGYFANDSYAHQDNDCIVDHCDFRDCPNPHTSGDGEPYPARVGFRPPGDEPDTGTKSLKYVTFSAHALTSTSLSVFFDGVRKFSPEHVYVDRMMLKNFSNPITPWSKIFSRHVGSFGATNGEPAGGIPISESCITGDKDNPKPFWEWATTYSRVFIEHFTPVDSADAGDYVNASPSRQCIFEDSVIIDQFGSCVFNALAGERDGEYIIRHCTTIFDMQHPTNGFIRNENSGTYVGANLRSENNIVYIRSNPSGNPAIRVYNMETAGLDQLAYFDYNAYWGVSTDPAIVYFQVESATKGAPGSEEGWGLNDWVNTNNPEFVDVNRGIISFGAAHGVTGYENTIAWLLNGINGYNPATGKQDPSLVTGITVDDLLAHIRGGMAPTNIVFKDSGSDGVTRGAIEWVPAGGGGGSIVNLTSLTLTSYSLRSQSL